MNICRYAFGVMILDGSSRTIRPNLYIFGIVEYNYVLYSIESHNFDIIL